MEILKSVLQAFGEISKHSLMDIFIEVFGPVGISKALFNPVVVAGNVLTGFLVLLFQKKFFVQGAESLKKDFRSVLSFGALFYLLSFGIIMIYFTSIVGYGVGVFLTSLLVVFIYLGQFPLAIAVGNFITRGKNVFFDLLIGYFSLEVIKLIPYVDWLLTSIIIPVLAIGIVFRTVSNLFFEKKYFVSPYENDNSGFNKKEMYDIIMRKENREDKSNNE